MPVEIREVKTKSDCKEFVNVPFEIYRGNKFWVPPIKADEVKALMPETNPAFDFCKAKFWLAYRNARLPARTSGGPDGQGKCFGRIGGIINEAYIEKSGEKMARFTRLEFFDDAEVSAKLIETAENWAKENGMTGIHGPLGFTNLDTQGVLVEGFDYLPSIASVYHHPYYHRHLEKLGYQKEIDWVEFRLTVAPQIPEKALRLNEMVKQRYGLKVITFKKNSELMPYAKKVFAVLNEAFAELFSVVALNEKTIDYYTNRYFKLLNPEFVKVILDNSENVVGFIVGLPSLSKAMQKANGKLFPFGFIHIMNALKKPQVVDLMLTGVLPKMQGQGVPAVLITELQRTLIQHGVKFAETTGIFENNEKAITTWKNYEHIQHKRKRCYRKMF